MFLGTTLYANSAPPSPPGSINGVRGNFQKKLTKCQGGVTCDGLVSHPGESCNTLSIASRGGNWDKLSWIGYVGADF